MGYAIVGCVTMGWLTVEAQPHPARQGTILGRRRVR